MSGVSTTNNQLDVANTLLVPNMIEVANNVEVPNLLTVSVPVTLPVNPGTL
jgi:hypothetical protein